MSELTVPRGWVAARERLRQEIVSCLESGLPAVVNLSLPKHAITSNVLRSLVYDPKFIGQAVPVVFSDGSQPTPFPVGALEEIPRLYPQEAQPLIRLGLMSFRHPELDYLVDFYACRNLEIVEKRSMAEEEEYSYARAVTLLNEEDLLAGALIEVYHTGLEPMVVGFYRGVVETLRRRKAKGKPRNLAIRPKLFAEPPTRERLGPNSPGAKPERYIADTDWQ